MLHHCLSHVPNAQRVLESCVDCPGKHIVDDPKLLDFSQSLKLQSVYDIIPKVIPERNLIVDAVLDIPHWFLD
jgi:hypothetical protein